MISLVPSKKVILFAKQKLSNKKEAQKTLLNSICLMYKIFLRFKQIKSNPIKNFVIFN